MKRPRPDLGLTVALIVALLASVSFGVLVSLRCQPLLGANRFEAHNAFPTLDVLDGVVASIAASIAALFG